MTMLFHGTDADFTTFAARKKATNFPDSGLVVLGYSFTPHKEYAKQFGSTLLEVSVAMKNPYHASRKRADQVETMHPRSVRRWKKRLKDQGHDGVVFAAGSEVEEHVPFCASLIRIMKRSHSE